MPTPLELFHNVITRGEMLVTESQKIPNLYNAVATLTKSPERYTYDNVLLPTDMSRSGIVLAVAAMDDYFTRKYSQVLVASIRKRGVNDSLARVLSDGGLDVKAALELLTMARPYRRVRKIAQDYYSTYSAQRADKIDSLFSTLGLTFLSRNAERRSRRKTLLRSVENLVQRRHKTVHGGDLNRHGKVQKVNPTDALSRINAIKTLVESADAIIDNYIS